MTVKDYNDDMGQAQKYLVYLFFIINVIIIGYIWYFGSGFLLLGDTFAVKLITFGRLSGLLLVGSVLAQLLLIGRISWIESSFGLDVLARWHQRNGKYVIFPLLILHTMFMIVGYALLNNVNIIAQEIHFLTQWQDLLNALLAFFLFIGIIFLSITIVRRHLKYEFWYLTHLFTYLAILLAWGHQLKWGGDFMNQWEVVYWYLLYAFVALNFLYFRFIKFYWMLFVHRFQVEKVIKETDDVYSVYITGKNMQNVRFLPGQFVILRFFVFHDLWNMWQAHPFSLSAMPNGQYLRVTPKLEGDYTSAVIPHLKKGTYVLIDGPHGIFTKKVMHKDKLLFLAAGIGITPIRGLVEEALIDKKDVVLLYSNKTEKDIVFREEIDELAKSYPLNRAFILTEPHFAKGIVRGKQDYELGRMDADKILHLVKDIKTREVFICGPIPFIDAMRNAALSLGIEEKYIHFEKFEF